MSHEIHDAPSSACHIEPHCVRQVGHAGDCSPTFFDDDYTPEEHRALEDADRDIDRMKEAQP